jgi:hypothetical protein
VYALKKVKLVGQDASVLEGYKNEILLLQKLKGNPRIISLESHDASKEFLLMVKELTRFSSTAK